MKHNVPDGMDICLVNSIANRLRKLRQSKDYSQQNMADELGISKSAYSKIETGSTDPSIKRMQAIAKILDVEVVYFFQEQQLTTSKVEESKQPIGFATKSDIEELTISINKMKQEIAALKANLPTPPVKKKKK